jgi:hypothetical protein
MITPRFFPRGAYNPRSQAPAWERKFLPKLCLGKVCIIADGYISFVVLQSGAWQEKWVSKPGLGNQRNFNLEPEPNHVGRALPAIPTSP